jgi:uncharacterized protein (TIGR04255 family)
MGAKLKNPPVYLTVAQVRFNSILKLADFVPAIQESFRKAAYPDYVPHVAVSLKLDMEGGQVTPTPAHQQKHVLGNAAKTHSFTLDTNALTLYSTEYGQFESFSEEFLKGLARLHEVVGLAFIDRVGLRYLDRVVPLEGEELAQYLVAEALGLTARLDGTLVHSLCETRTDQDGIKLISRTVTLSSPLIFPPDLMPLLGVEVADRFKAYTGLNAVLDNDGAFEGREEYATESVRGHLDAIHKVIGAAFKSVVTPYARKKWDE